MVQAFRTIRPSDQQTILNPPLLHAQGLIKSFGPRRVLAGIDLELGAGETLAIVGPNGAGKTTLLRCLAGLMRPDRGQVEIEGVAVSPREPESRRRIGLLSHRSMLYDDLTLQENLAFAARLHRAPDPAGVARRALDEMELGSRAGDQPRTLSRGLLQRAALARALVNQPAVLLLDEPFTGLDAHAAHRLRALLTARRPAGLGTIVVTHQVHEAWSLATRVIALVEGRWALEADLQDGAERFMARYLEATGD